VATSVDAGAPINYCCPRGVSVEAPPTQAAGNEVMPSGSAIRSGVTDLLPNLPDLLAALATSSAGRDAAELAGAAGEVMTVDDVDAALDRVVSRWATP